MVDFSPKTCFKNLKFNTGKFILKKNHDQGPQIYANKFQKNATVMASRAHYIILK